MPRAYLRLDPAFEERKAHYPDGPFAALIASFCLAEHQPQRGRFRSATYLRALLGRRGRFVPFLLAEGDLVELDGGRVYIDGWDEWQEGDWKVTERVSRIRNRPRNGRPPTQRNGEGNGRCNGGGNGLPQGGSGAEATAEAVGGSGLTSGSGYTESESEEVARWPQLRAVTDPVDPEEQRAG